MIELENNFTHKSEKELYDIFSEALFKETMFKQFWEKQPVLNCIIDANGIFVGVNEHWRKVLGYEKSELIGKPFFDFILDKDIAKSKMIFDKNQRKNCQLKVLRNRWISKSGKEVPVKWYPFSVNLENGIATTGIENG